MDNSLQDRQLVCVECGSKFVYTVGEQEFYKQKGFENEPKRCQACRGRRKKERGGRKPFKAGFGGPRKNQE